MGDLYASAVGTTVLILKEIPPRPKEFDGALALFGEMKDGVDEAAVRTALARYGDIQSCSLKHSPPVVYFVEHASAVKAASSVGAASILSDCPCAGLFPADHPNQRAASASQRKRFEQFTVEQNRVGGYQPAR